MPAAPSAMARALRVAAVGPRLEVGGAVAHRRRRAAGARALQQRAVGEDERRHPRRAAGQQHARVVAALRLGDLLAVEGRRRLRLADRRHRLHRHAEVDVRTRRDAPRVPPTWFLLVMIAGAPAPPPPAAQRTGRCAPSLASCSRRSPGDLEALRRRQREHRVRHHRLEAERAAAWPTRRAAVGGAGGRAGGRVHLEAVEGGLAEAAGTFVHMHATVPPTGPAPASPGG